MLDFFNEILSLLQRIILDYNTQESTDSQSNDYYFMGVEQYFSMCIKIGRAFHISPKEIYETWPLPMMLVTYAEVNNDSLNKYIAEEKQLNSKVKHHYNAKDDFIKNITVDMLTEISDIDNQNEKHFDEAHNALLEFYGG